MALLWAGLLHSTPGELSTELLQTQDSLVLQLEQRVIEGVFDSLKTLFPIVFNISL